MEQVNQIAKHFKNDPVRYARIILGVTLTPDQERILRLLTVPPYKVLVKAGHTVGKSYLAAVAVLWYYHTHSPSIVLTTAPTDRQVGTIWKEIRMLWPWGGFIGPKAHELRTSPKHYARGLTATDSTAFQGHHELNVMIVFDEAVGVDEQFWTAADTMLNGDSYAFLAIFNPTDQSSYAYTAEQSGNFHVVTLSSLTHPNIAAEAKGLPPPYPSAVRFARLGELIRQWGTLLAEPPLPTDVEWPPHSGQWYRPSPVLEARQLGRWPSLSMNSVWTLATWEKAEGRQLPLTGALQIGADIARFGDDNTCLHVRKGGCSLHHETHNGWSTSQTAARLRVLCEQFGSKHGVNPQRIPVAIDVCGVGGGVVDQAHGYAFIGINSASKALTPLEFPNMRSQLYFALADEAARGNVSFALLPNDIRSELRRELLSPTYQIDAQGRRVVESKDRTKARIGRSPDNSDAVHLAFTSINPLVN